MHKLVPVPALAAVLVLAMPTWTASAAESHGDNGHRKTVVGSDRGTFTTTPSGTQLLTEDHAVGRARHIGRYSLEASELINPVTFDVTDGVFTMTTAHGALNGSYAGSAAGIPGTTMITYHAAGPVLGGSGRFAGVTGWLTFDGVADLGSGKLCDRVTGWISTSGHDADDRRASSATALSAPLPCHL